MAQTQPNLRDFQIVAQNEKGKTEEHEERKSQLEMRNSGGHEEDLGLHSHTKNHRKHPRIFQLGGPLSGASEEENLV